MESLWNLSLSRFTRNIGWYCIKFCFWYIFSGFARVWKSVLTQPHRFFLVSFPCPSTQTLYSWRMKMVSVVKNRDKLKHSITVCLFFWFFFHAAWCIFVTSYYLWIKETFARDGSWRLLRHAQLLVAENNECILPLGYRGLDEEDWELCSTTPNSPSNWNCSIEEEEGGADRLLYDFADECMTIDNSDSDFNLSNMSVSSFSSRD